MEVKPGYKQTEVGVIPEEWDAAPLNSITPQNRKNGIVDGPFGSNLKTIHYRTAGIPIVTSGYVTDGRFHAEKYLYVDREKFIEEKRSAVQPGDIVMAKIGERCGASAILPLTHEIGILSGNALKISVDQSRHSTTYIWQILWSLHVSGKLEILRTTGAQPALSMANLKRFKIPVPPLPEQRAIATALSDVDGLLGGLDRLIAKKRDLKQAAMQQLLTGQTRLTGFHGEWEVKPLGELIFRLKKTTRPSSSGRAEGAYPFFTNTAKPVDKFLDEADFDTEAIIANTGGEAYFNYYNGNFAAMADCFVFKASLVTLFLYYFLKSVERAVNDNGFTGSGIKHLDKKFFYQMEVRCPAELPEQTAIATVLSEMDGELAVLEQRREKTRALKQAMMQELLTGKIRLL